MMQGKTPTSVPEIRAGDLGAVAKLKDTLTNDTLAEKNGLSFAPIAFSEPVLSYAIEPKSRGDEDKISHALARIAEEDPTVHHHFDPETKHVEVHVHRLRKKLEVGGRILIETVYGEGYRLRA